jgi:DNA-binding response OmpR family regulator
MGNLGEASVSHLPPISGKILIADDDELMRKLIEHKLSMRGLTVIEAADGEEALQKITSEKPDLVILDGMMPGIDGFEVLRNIRENEATRNLRVVLLTARKMESDVVSGLTLGADEYITKPFMPEELLARIIRLLAQARSVGA